MIRTYGNPPYQTMVLHGGPGALGALAPVAKALAAFTGVVEPIQSKYTIRALVEELREQQRVSTCEPVTIIGHSWGAWLAGLYAAEYPERVNRLVLVGSGPLEEAYVPEIARRRLARFPATEQVRFQRLVLQLEDTACLDKDKLLKELGTLVDIADYYEKVQEHREDVLEPDGEQYACIWKEAAALRKSGELLRKMKRISCPVYVIHGRQDPHPLEGVTEPLQRAGVAFRQYILERCGHEPFAERHARTEFYEILGRILTGEDML